MENLIVVDLFCGAGGLTHGFKMEDIKVVAGVDSDLSCKYAYEKNNNALFVHKDIRELSSNEISDLYPDGAVKVLVGCVPCQPFSTYVKGKTKKHSDRNLKLLYEFSRLVKEVHPDIVSMENVPGLKKHKIFRDFVRDLEKLDYEISYYVVYCPDYGIPQSRTRLVLFASRLGKIDILEKTHTYENYLTVKDVIGKLEPLGDGESSHRDPFHRTSRLSTLNKLRIKSTPEGGSWKDWDESIVAACHKKESGKSYSGIYGRMRWDMPAPTVTTQCCGFGNGRFGHPEQHRAISLREAALIQTFPEYYEFSDPSKPFSIKRVAAHIGNAVPVELGRVIAKSIKKHLLIEKNNEKNKTIRNHFK